MKGQYGKEKNASMPDPFVHLYKAIRKQQFPL
jgi:hypothetical protein